MDATTMAVATVSLMITVRRYRCSQSLVGRLIAPFAGRSRVVGKGLANPPCRTEPPKVPSGSTYSPHTAPPREAPTSRTVPPPGATPATPVSRT
ncbi:hypothetical protein GCM10017557_19490 [Streptomyces aurantiacus]|uniref:Uncharacterized protein n=1 Tax=Streptomyces aurantiacus TaxID=47760 RepID=A0A7G1NZL5_9ACTN|nr:hypothetical protein GCM10017557_19490 [Streptomyces aurantiacus]